MNAKVRRYTPTQTFLLPPQPLEWLDDDHFAMFIYKTLHTLESNGQLDEFNQKLMDRHSSGNPTYHFRMMLAILIYSYSVGVHSSRKFATALCESLPLRFLAGGNFPSYRTINRFRKDNFKYFSVLFVKIIELAKEVGRAKFDDIAIDGTKIKANASKLKNRKLVEEELVERTLTEAVQEHIKKAEEADAQGINCILIKRKRALKKETVLLVSKPR